MRQAMERPAELLADFEAYASKLTYLGISVVGPGKKEE